MKGSRAHRRKAHKRHVRYLWLALAVSGMVAVGLWTIYYVAHLPFWRIDTIEVHGTVSIDENDVREEVRSVLSGNHGFLVPRDGVFVYPKQQLYHTLSNTFLRIDSVTIATDGLRVLDVHVLERQPYLTWCPDNTTVHDACLVADAQGVWYATSSAQHTLLEETVRYRAGTSTSPTLGGVFLDDSFGAVVQLIDELSVRYGWQVRSLQPYQPSGIRLVFGDGRYIVVDPTVSPDTVLENIYTVLESTELSVDADDPDSFQYIDLRYGERLFIR